MRKIKMLQGPLRVQRTRGAVVAQKTASGGQPHEFSDGNLGADAVSALPLGLIQLAIGAAIELFGGFLTVPDGKADARGDL